MSQLFKSFLVLCTAVISFASCNKEVLDIPVLPDQDIVVMYENDVHCATEGYAKFAALRSEYEAQTPYVTTVSAGDFVQGGIMGTLTNGEGVTKIMNHVGYDIVTPGNHEFDYGMERCIISSTIALTLRWCVPISATIRAWRLSSSPTPLRSTAK